MSRHHQPEATLVQIDGKIARANSRALDLVGADSLSELRTRSIRDLFDPDDKPTPSFSDHPLAEGQDPTFDVLKLKRLDGGTMTVKASSTVSQRQGKALLKVILEPFQERRGFDRRREINDVLRAKREWESTFDSVSELIAVLDMKGIVKRVNGALARRIGLAYRQVLGSAFQTVFEGIELPAPPGDKGGDGTSAETVEVYLNRFEGFFRITCSPFWGPRGGQEGWVLIARDITKRKQAEEALAFERNRLLDILDAMQDGVAIIDTDFRIEYLNPALESELGSVGGRKCHRYFHDLDQQCPWCKFSVVTTGRSCQWECHFRKNNKTYDLISTPFVKNEGETWQLVIMRDVSLRKRSEEALRQAHQNLEKRVEERTAELREINRRLTREVTERKMAERELEAQQRQLRQADKMAALGTVVSGVAHEINNPNNFISINAPLLKELWIDVLEHIESGGGEIDLPIAGSLGRNRLRERVPLLCQGIIDGSQRIRNIVKELKEFSGSERFDLARPVDINQVIEAAVSLLQHNISKATHKFTLKTGVNMPLIRGHFQRLEQVLINLILNACQAIPDPDRAIAIGSSYDPQAQKVVMTVSDEGIGIPAEDLAQVTDPFFTTKRHMGGTGLGLAVSSRIVNDHGGRLEFSSRPGMATEARVILPVDSRQIREQG